MKNIINMLKRGDELMPLTMIDEGTPYTILDSFREQWLQLFLKLAVMSLLTLRNQELP